MYQYFVEHGIKVNQRKGGDADAGTEVEVKAISTQATEQTSTDICF